MTDPVKLEPTVPDREIAANLRERIERAMGAAIEIMNEAKALGLEVGWSTTRDQFGRHRLGEITIFRPL